jgi:ribonuclease P/MRP protein subunit POP1
MAPPKPAGGLNGTTGKKRRADGPPLSTSRNMPKRRKPEIPVQHAQKGEVNVANFVKAREFEINALEANMRTMRKSLAARAFQQLPRHMRRRTASHNVKKVPRRLRKRALKEVCTHGSTLVEFETAHNG